jgi:serine/threonine-protein kinase
MLDSQGRAVLVDFGIAQCASTASGPSSILRAGTPRYVAPEVLFSDQIDQRADIYSLGLVASEIFCGPLPPSKRSPRGVVSDPLCAIEGINLAHLPPALATLIKRCLARNPEERISSIERVLALLQEASSPSVLPEKEAKVASL